MSEDDIAISADRIATWAQAAVAPWAGQSFSSRIEDAAGSSASTYIYRYDGTQLSFDPKPVIDGDPQSWAYGKRAEQYHDLFQRALRRRSTKPGIFAINVCDGGAPQDDIPIFGFQRPKGSRRILMPDPEMLNDNHLADDALPDRFSYDEKRVAATFVGSTTGGGHITRAAVEGNIVPRIRAARFFQSHRHDVVFELPNLVHFESQDVVDFVRSFGFSDGGLIPWREQLACRFIISIDGHGAACSRIRIGLGSNSVLIKYASPHELYYFCDLKEDVHFVEVSANQDVLNIVRQEKQVDGFYRNVAVNGREFWRRYLGRDAMDFYCLELATLFMDAAL